MRLPDPRGLHEGGNIISEKLGGIVAFGFVRFTCPSEVERDAGKALGVLCHLEGVTGVIGGQIWYENEGLSSSLLVIVHCNVVGFDFRHESLSFAYISGRNSTRLLFFAVVPGKSRSRAIDRPAFAMDSTSPRSASAAEAGDNPIPRMTGEVGIISATISDVVSPHTLSIKLRPRLRLRNMPKITEMITKASELEKVDAYMGRLKHPLAMVVEDLRQIILSTDK